MRVVETSNKEKAAFREEIGRLNARLLERSSELDLKNTDICELRSKLAAVQASISDICPRNPSEGLNADSEMARHKLQQALQSATEDFDKQIRIF